MLFRMLVFGLFLALSLVADEGIWLFDSFPKKLIQTKYDFNATPEFLQHLDHSWAFLSFLTRYLSHFKILYSLQMMKERRNFTQFFL